MNAHKRGQMMVGVAVALSLVLAGVYLAAGGASYAPAKTQDPCKHRPWRDPQGLEQITEQFTLSALDGAACKLGVSREELAQALATDEARQEFTESHGISDPELAVAVRAGLLRAVDDAEDAGALSPLLAGPARAMLRSVPLDQAIDLINNADSLLGGSEGLLGGAEGLVGGAEELLEELLP
jgi:hypothetical protein